MNETSLVRADVSVEDARMIEAVVIGGDLSKLNAQQRMDWYLMRCQAAGLDPRTQPFEYITLQGKLTLYAKKGAADQIASNNSLSTQIISKSVDDYISVQVRVSDPHGRFTEDIGIVPTPGQRGDMYANAILKAVSKAKRRAILSHCGLGMLDETEIESIPDARPAPPPVDVTANEPEYVSYGFDYPNAPLESLRAALEDIKANHPRHPEKRAIVEELQRRAAAMKQQAEQPVVEAEVVTVSAENPATEKQRERWTEACELAGVIGIEVPAPWPDLITEKDAEERLQVLDDAITAQEQAEQQAA